MNKKIGKGKLFLSGGGGAQDSFLLDQEFVKSLRAKTVLYIPIALQRDPLGYEACYDWIVSTLSVHSDDFIEIIMWLDLKTKTLDDLKKFEAIYIGGGNTYKLLQTFHETGFDKVIVKFLKQGGIIYGGSAGAIIMGKNISTVSEENDDDYKFDKGLFLLGNYSLICHYDFSKNKQIEHYIQKYRNPVIALTEKGGIIIENNCVKVIGYESALIFDEKLNKKNLKPKEIFYVS